MKILTALLFVLMTLAPQLAMAAYTPRDVVKKLVALDQHDGFVEGMTVAQATTMIRKAALLCRSKDNAKYDVNHIAGMVDKAHELLAKDDVMTSRLALLDVLNGILGDRSPHNCAAILGLYVEGRTTEGKHASHISTYKVLQAMRDNGML